MCPDLDLEGPFPDSDSSRHHRASTVPGEEFYPTPHFPSPIGVSRDM
jgi:hypothetical protein